MARTEIPVYLLNRDEFVPESQVAGDISNGMFFANNEGYTFLEIENPGTIAWIASAVVHDHEIDGIPIDTKDIDVEPGSAVKFGPFPIRIYSQENADVYIEAESSDLLFRAFTTQ